MTTPHRNIGVVGSGVAGLTAAYVASRTAHVTLFEADERLGGHADTHVVEAPEGRLHIDTGFIVHNPRTYPTLLRLFAELDIATQPSEMSLSVSDQGSGVEWAGALGARGLFPTRAAATSADHWRMLAAIPRFHRRARAVLAAADRSRPDASSGTDALGAPSYDASTTADQTLREFLVEGASPPTSCGTSWSPSSQRCGRATPRPRSTTPPATCSRSSSTTACSACSARRSGAPSPGVRGRMSTQWPRSCRPSARAPRSPRCTSCPTAWSSPTATVESTRSTPS
ncbi:NAD(P)-binding protein [Nocardioides piscis]|uniref:NAD(P)-binding protein n=1 Tax=Nocardioides piscis TaxID=2714938 RepID=A0A6G7YEH3_9ACTN|nr:NAD(P)-binding protein [Nocardioides piscis]